MVVFKGCSHMARYEDPMNYFRTHGEFLREVS